MHAHKSDVLPMVLPGSPNADREMRRIGVAGFVGTVIEFFDLQIYSTAAALVFAHVFFPQLGRVAGTVAAFGTIGVVFIARPLGSIIFGHFGDRLGRKKTLVVSLLMMGLSTVLVGLLPTSEQIGIIAPILLISLRVVQGLAAGGEFAGAALIISENAPVEKRGAWSALPAMGGAVALSAGALTFAVTSMAMSADAFRTWGWRIPFLFSTVLLLLGLYIRLRMNETPVFAKELRLRGASRFPVLDAIASQPRDMPLSCMVAVPAFTMLYLVVTYVLNYGASELRLGYTTVTLVSVASGIIMLLGVLVTSRLSDRIGRRATLIGANGLATLWAVLLFPVLHAGTFAAYAVAVVVTMFIAGFIFGPIGSYMSELFDTRYRYTAVGLCYNASGILGGAVPPLIAGPIISAYGTIVFGTVLAIMCFVCLCCCIALPETKHRALDVNMETK